MALPLRDIQLRLSKEATGVLLFTTWDSVAGPGCVFITAGPIIKLCAGGEGDSEGHGEDPKAWKKFGPETTGH